MELAPLDLVIYIFAGSSVLSMVRIVLGPSPEDKMIGLNLVAAQVLAILVLVAVKLERPILLDVALVYAVLGFVGILAIADEETRKDVPVVTRLQELVQPVRIVAELQVQSCCDTPSQGNEDWDGWKEWTNFD